MMMKRRVPISYEGNDASWEGNEFGTTPRNIACIKGQ